MVITLLLIMIITLSACSNENEAPIPYLNITLNDGRNLNESMVNISSDGGEVVFNIDSNSTWQAECNSEWINISAQSGTGSGSVVAKVESTTQSRSAVVVIYLSDYKQIKSSCDIIQHASPPTDTPDDDTQEPSDSPEQNPTEQPAEPPTDTPNDNPTDTPTDNPEENQPSQAGAYSLINNLSGLAAGEYYIGGYQDGKLHLATKGMQTGHCKTVRYDFTDDGDLTPLEEQEAVIVKLEAAAENGYYILFDDGYLAATGAGAGKLVLTSERSRYWIFSAHDDGGFVVKQAGDIDVQLIISPKATNGALLRSVAGDEQGNAIVLFRKNKQ